MDKRVTGKKIISGLGFVQLIDHMGDDAAIAQAARVSYGHDLRDYSTAADERLIRYLMRHEHWSPFEMVEIKLVIEAPIFIARQWMRHRTASVNEISGRYTDVTDLGRWEPWIDDIRGQGAGPNRQTGDGALPSVAAVGAMRAIRQTHRQAMRAYREMLDDGVAREIARAVLPVAHRTRWVWKIDLRNALHFLRLRLGHDAQTEIRHYAHAVAEIVAGITPAAWRAFQDYHIDAVRLGRPALRALALRLAGASDPEGTIMREMGVSKGEAQDAVAAADKIIYLTSCK